MAGTKAGGLKAAKTNKLLYGRDFYVKAGRKGGQASTTGGFYANPELAKVAGAKGGRNSRRGKALEIDGIKYKKDGTPYKKYQGLLPKKEAERLEKAIAEISDKEETLPPLKMRRSLFRKIFKR